MRRPASWSEGQFRVIVWCSRDIVTGFEMIRLRSHRIIRLRSDRRDHHTSKPPPPKADRKNTGSRCNVVHYSSRKETHCEHTESFWNFRQEIRNFQQANTKHRFYFRLLSCQARATCAAHRVASCFPLQFRSLSKQGSSSLAIQGLNLQAFRKGQIQLFVELIKQMMVAAK